VRRLRLLRLARGGPAGDGQLPLATAPELERIAKVSPEVAEACVALVLDIEASVTAHRELRPQRIVVAHPPRALLVGDVLQVVVGPREVPGLAGVLQGQAGMAVVVKPRQLVVEGAAVVGVADGSRRRVELGRRPEP
jgi:hypothetical protein